MTNLEYLSPIIIFAFTMLFTPGPNNIMLASSGANFGILKSLPHIFGVTIGFGLMLFCVCLGFGEIYLKYPLAKTIMQWGGIIILLYIAWKILTAKKIYKDQAKSKAFGFFLIALFQWVNPKAWIISIGVSSAYMKGKIPPFNEAMLISLVFILIGTFSSLFWTLLGLSLRNFLEKGNRLFYYNLTMALLVVSTIFYTFI